MTDNVAISLREKKIVLIGISANFLALLAKTTYQTSGHGGTWRKMDSRLCIICFGNG
jgi:hypothetical protein